MKINRRWLAIAPVVAAALVAMVATSTGGAGQSKGVSGSITVWVDAVRLPAAKAYVEGAMRHGIALGKGHRPLNHFWNVRLD